PDRCARLAGELRGRLELLSAGGGPGGRDAGETGGERGRRGVGETHGCVHARQQPPPSPQPWRGPPRGCPPALPGTEERYEGDTTCVLGLPYEEQQFYDLGSAVNVCGVSDSLAQWALQSVMGRVNYAFKDRYLLTLTSRVDGSSRLAQGQKYGVFPSVALAW